MSSRPVGRWLFGKLPSLGDFVARGLDFGLRDGIDHWLSGEMQECRERFGDQFEERYDSAPAWCFVDCDPDGNWSGGALCASVDAAGRRFPIMIAAPAEDCAEAAALSGGCLEALYGAFASGWDADALQISPVTITEVPWQPEQSSWALLGEDGPAVVLNGRFPQGVMTTMVELAA